MVGSLYRKTKPGTRQARVAKWTFLRVDLDMVIFYLCRVEILRSLLASAPAMLRILEKTERAGTTNCSERRSCRYQGNLANL
jgi:hypothetical protein